MPSQVQFTHYQLPSPVFTAGGQWTQPLQNLPKQLFGRLAHVASLIFSCSETLTFTTKPTIPGSNNIALKADVFDGSILRFQGGFNTLRMKERLQSGGYRLAEVEANGATGVVRWVQRVLHFGTPQSMGFPTDFLIPCGMLTSGEIRFGWGNLTDFSADTTVAAATVRVVAKLGLLDELRIPPAYQFQSQAFSASDFIITGRGLYTEIGIYNTNFVTPFAAGDLGNVTLDAGYGFIVPTINARDLNISFNDDFNRGGVQANMGEPGSATDTANKMTNLLSGGTNTAMTAQDFDLAPILWMPPDGRLSKCFWAESQLRLRWDGSKTSGTVGYGRILSQPAAIVAQNIQKALAGTNLTAKSWAPSTLSKKPYTGPLLEFMPWKVKTS